MEARGRRISSAEARAVAVTLAALCVAAAVGAQEIPASEAAGAEVQGAEVAAPDGWNSEAALILIERAIEARRHAWADSSLERFRAEAQGHLYYIGDFRGQRHVIRADQVALDVRWQAPDRTVQTIVGRRHELRLPTNIQYHLDHLFLVLDNFGDRIRIGDGYEVEHVLHPAGTGAREFYDYRLADSLEIRIRGRSARVFELEVRPRESGTPAVVGSLFLERATGAIARMRLTFTPNAYLDRQIVRIVVDLRSALWEGRHWLPVEQDLEITRSLPWLDFPLETLIRTRLRVLDYHFDESAAFSLGPGQYVYAYPEEDLARFDGWETSLYGGPLEGAGVESGPTGDDLMRLVERAGRDLERAVLDARRLLPRQGLVGGRRLQLWFPNASGAIRARRAEGLLVGAGGAYRIDDLTELSLWGGFAAGEARPQARVGLRRRLGRFELEFDGWLRANRDVGREVASGTLQTLALLVEGEDYQDPYFADGGRAGLVRETGSARWRVGVSAERHRAADLVVRTTPFGEGTLRPVRPADEGDLAALDAGVALDLGRGLGARWGLDIAGEAATGAVGDFGFGRATVALRAARESLGGGWGWASEIEFGAAGGDLPAQRLFLLGGRGSLPGHAFRGWGGDRMGLWRAEVSRSLASPWVRLRARGAVGWAGLGTAGDAAARRFGVGESAGLRASAGIGLGLFYDLLRIDVMRGLGGGSAGEGDWVVLLSLDPRIRGIL
ncbi:hypothetical protein [Candidatus Palauibacter sp.]|uniref:hypothetical protein n=1 Tax=Candidatus Palauibacter sp. TaxID=3101350 RepID=UPI003CC50C9A